MQNIRLQQGDSLELLKALAPDSIDSVVTDPPYGLSFMNKKWDHDVPKSELWAECLRVLKPGGHLLAFFGSRTYHRGAVEVEDAGFEVRDQLMWLYGSGFPKSHNLGKAYDKKLGIEREVVGYSNQPGKSGHHAGNTGRNVESEGRYDAPITKGDGPLEGWGTALKPAHEPIVLARKPFKGSVVDNAIKHGVGGLNIDASRVGDEVFDTSKNRRSQASIDNTIHDVGYKGVAGGEIVVGRFPANVIHDGSEEVISRFPGEGDKDTSRFFYVPKVGKKERNAGLEDFAANNYASDGRDKTIDNAYQRGNAVSNNNHPTVKPIELMTYLIKLVTPEGGAVLDPFMGSGSTGCAAVQNGYDFIGFDLDENYVEIARARIEHWN